MALKDYIPATIIDAEGNEIENPEIEINRVASQNPGLDYIPEESAEQGANPQEGEISPKELKPIPLTDIKGIGDKSAAKLADAGIDTVYKFAEADPAKLVEILGAGYNVNRAENDILQALELIDAGIEPEG